MNANSYPSPLFIPKKHGAKSAGVSLRTFDRWIKRGLPTYQAYPGGKVLVRLSDIESFLKRNQRLQLNLNSIVNDVMETLRPLSTPSRNGGIGNTPALSTCIDKQFNSLPMAGMMPRVIFIKCGNGKPYGWAEHLLSLRGGQTYTKFSGLGLVKRRRKQYSEEFKKSVITYLRQNGLSANKVAKIYKLDQTTVSKWNRQIESGQTDAGTVATVISQPENRTRSRRDSSESLSTLFVIADDLLPELLKDCANRVTISRLTDPFHPERRAGEAIWKGIYCELDLCLRDIQSMTVQLKIDHSLLHQNYARMLVVREALTRCRHERLSCNVDQWNESEEALPCDPIGEEWEIISKIIVYLREIVISSRSSL